MPVIGELRLDRVRPAHVQARAVLGLRWADVDFDSRRVRITRSLQRIDGGPLDPDAYGKAFRRIAAKAGLSPNVRLHDVRHGVATTMLDRGVHPAIASAVLGHASPAFTMSTYQHVLDGMTDQAADALGIAFGR